ncbi:MAG: 2-oxoacid:acceptor oxidoreductase family protein, partial [Thermaerobacterales bacterium]
MLKTAATAELTATAAHEIFMAGYGGQGVMLAGEILARAALDEGREIAFTRSYGPQMRGGTANCSVVIAGGPIDFPVAESPTAAVFFNAPSLPAFQSLLRPGALMIVNTSLIDDFAGRDDLVTLGLPLNDLAREIGSDRVLNIIALG